MLTKYSFEVDGKLITMDVNRLTNQIWKLIPMKENDENWNSQLVNVLDELIGLNQIFVLDEKYLILLSKLEGLRLLECEFTDFRRIVFESISLLREVFQNASKN